MDNYNQNPAHIIKERRILTVRNKILYGGIILIIATIFVVAGLLMMNKLNLDIFQPSDAPAGRLDAYGLENNIDKNIKPTGEIDYFVITSGAATNSLPSASYKYDLILNQSKIRTIDAIAEINPIKGSSTSLVLAPVTGTDLSLWEPQLYTQNNPTSTLVRINSEDSATPNSRLRLASDNNSFSYATHLSPESWTDSLTLWGISLNTLDKGKTDLIPEAYSGEWLKGGEKFLYLKKDGIYLYEVNSKSSKFVFSVYPDGSKGYEDTDEIAISPDDKTVIVTRPSFNLILILDLITNDNELVLRDKAWISTEAISYNSPRFSPDGKHYAVVAKKAFDILGEGASTTYKLNAAIEIRQVNSSSVEQLLELPSTDAFKGIYISNWSAK